MKKRIVLLLLFLLLLAGTASAEGSLLQDFVLLLPQIRSSQTLPVGSGAILRHADGENFRYNFPDGDVYFQHSGTGSARWLLPLQTVTVRRANSDGTWYVVRNPRRFSAQSTVFLETEGLHLVLSPPMAYRPMEHDCLQAVPQLDG